MRQGASARWRRRLVGSVLVLVVVLPVVGACTGDGRPTGVGRQGRVVGEGDTYRATIARTDGDIPHITGDTVANVTFGQGFASGQDRACDLADQVVKIRGERSRWFGAGTDDANLRSDLAWRAIGIVDRAAGEWAAASADVHRWVTAFASGWNAHLASVGADGVRGWCAGAAWVRPVEPLDVWAYARSGDLEASSAALVPYLGTAQPPEVARAAGRRSGGVGGWALTAEDGPAGSTPASAPGATDPAVGDAPATSVGGGVPAGAGPGAGPAAATSPTTGPAGGVPSDGSRVRTGPVAAGAAPDGPDADDPAPAAPFDQVRELVGDDWSSEPSPTTADVPARGGRDRASSLRGHVRHPYAGDPAAMRSAAGAPALEAVTTSGATGPGAAGPGEAVTEPLGLGSILPSELAGSNAWAIGRDRSAGGGGMLLANPHHPWQAERRFGEVHLTIPGVLDAYGAQLSGRPGLAVGFTDTVAWAQSAAAGTRFTAYRLALVPGDPTRYRVGDQVLRMTAREVTVDVLGDDGQVRPTTRTLWSTSHGPILDLPGIGWTATTAVALRDANIDDDESLEHTLATLRSESLDELMAVHDRVGGAAYVDTIATGPDGRTWFAGTAATPDLSPAALAGYRRSLADDPVVRGLADQGIVLLDGSDPETTWVVEPGARDPGLLPPADLPRLVRTDHVFTGNDSFWLPHPSVVIEGDWSPLLGDQRTARSLRTRETATVLSDPAPGGPSGPDGLFDLHELTTTALSNRSHTARALLDAVVERCDGAPPVGVPALAAGLGGEPLPAETVYVGAACAVLARWDGSFDADRAGPPLWREMMARFEPGQLVAAGQLWAEPFDPARPVTTPAGLATAAPGQPDPVLGSLARAVQVLDAARIPVDATLGDVQVARLAAGGEGTGGDRGGGASTVALHGGLEGEGVTNLVGLAGGDRAASLTPGGPAPAAGAGWSRLVGVAGAATSLDPAIAAVEVRPVVPRSPLGRWVDRRGPMGSGETRAFAAAGSAKADSGGADVGGFTAGDDGADRAGNGYLVTSGPSFLLAVEFRPSGPQARTLMAYGNAGDGSGDAAALQRYASKSWRDVAFTPTQVASAATDVVTVRA